MSAYDEMQMDRHCLRWCRIDKDLPGGLHRPKNKGDVGWDLEAMTDVVLAPGQGADIAINLAIDLPPGVYADIRNRSSMARRGLYVDQSLIDNGYRGELFVFVRNVQPVADHWGYFRGDGSFVISDRDYMRFVGQPISNANAVYIQAGERVAQLVFHRFTPLWDAEVEEVDRNTERGTAGFGSTGR